ncbi:GNAT family N-acetyltransferase [Halomonas ventosae]|uniref:Phosphinothricin acetyltransferase n=1 Tax=Halomonas ventosae TaxID=229007 RepID=A0A4R6HWA7_9GAMM|nr:GNAT family N-acetyltransferase [Halomonas ventosae]TDO12675.1 phosphinothricin acetyltransferase [Halomonas ventosae]
MSFTHREATIDDLPRIVEIYNHAIETRRSTCDVEPLTTESREAWFYSHSGSCRPIWVAEDSAAPEKGVVGYLNYSYFMNDRPGYFITSDMGLYLHPDYQGKGLGSYLLGQAIEHAPALGIEVLSTTIFASNTPSIRLFEKFQFERWGFMPKVARMGDIEHDLVMVGRRVTS